MTLTELQQKLRERIRVAARETFGVDLQQINAEIPPRAELGDLAFPVSFELAKLIKQATGEKQNPRAIAEKLKTQLEDSTRRFNSKIRSRRFKIENRISNFETRISEFRS